MVAGPGIEVSDEDAMDDDATEGVRVWEGRVLAGILGIVLVVLVVLGVVLYGDRAEPAPDPLRPADIGSGVGAADSGAAGVVVVVARQGATAFFSLDHRHVQADIARMEALSTGDFLRQYTAQAETLSQSVISKKLVVTADLPEDGTATEYLAPTTAQILVSVNVTTTSIGGASDDARYRTRVQLQLVEGEWLVSGLDQVG